MALLQIAEPGESAAPHEHRLAAGIDLGTTNSLIRTQLSYSSESTETGPSGMEQPVSATARSAGLVFVPDKLPSHPYGEASAPITRTTTKSSRTLGHSAEISIKIKWNRFN